jgi:outer membrane receptor protein involved in Fe transport
LSGKAGELFQYFAGVYFQSDHQDFHGVFSANRAALGTGDTRPAFARVVGVDQEARTTSGFVSLAVPVGQFVSVEPSVRYTRISRNGTQFAYGAEVMSTVRTNAYNAFLAGVFGATPHEYELSVPEHHWMPQLVVTYKPTGQLNFFAKYTDGAKSGGIDANYVSANPAQAVFAAETVKSVEAGVKADLFDRRASTSLTLFNSKYKDLQVNIFNDPIFVVRNAGGQRSRGAELETNFRATSAITLGASLTYLDAIYTDFRGAACTLSQALTRPAPCTQDLTGHRSGFSSKWYGTAYVDYHTQIGGYALNFGVDASGRSEYSPTTSDDREVGLQDGIVLLNARAELAPTDGPWTVALFGRNLTNEIYTNFVTPGGAGQTRGVSAATLERTRQVGLELKVVF